MIVKILLGTLIIFASLNSQAQTTPLSERVQTQASVRGASWSGDRGLSDENNFSTLGLWGKTTIDLEDKGQMVGNGFFQSIVSPQSPDNANDEQNIARVRELYWKLDSDAWNLRIGRQLIAWGRADGLNPTDNLSPKQFTLLTPEDTDLRFGNDAINVGYQVGDHTFNAIWFPRISSNVIPLEVQPGVTYEKKSPTEHDQYALKWETLGSAFDASVSWFDGYDPMPDLKIASLSPQGIILEQSNNKFRVLGADFSCADGNKVWRLEAAVSDTDSLGRDDFTHKKSRVWIVGGPEWTLNNGLTVNLQLSLQRVGDYASPSDLPQPFQAVAWRELALSNQTEKNQQGITWRIAKTALNDTLLLETTGVSFSDSSGLSRSKINYAISDALHVQLGYEHYYGSTHTFFGQLKDNNNVYLELRYNL